MSNKYKVVEVDGGAMCPQARISIRDVATEVRANTPDCHACPNYAGFNERKHIVLCKDL